jgi:transposase
MRRGIELRPDYDAARLRALAKATRHAGQSRRLLALAEIYEGGSRTRASRVGGVGLQTVRDWVVRFNARGPDGLIESKAPGNPCKLNAQHRDALVALVESGPVPAIHGVVRWRLKDLVQWVWDEVRIALSETTLSRELRALGYRRLSARPRHHAKSDAAVAAFKKRFPRVWRTSRKPRLMASRSRSGLPTRRGSVRRTKSRGAGPGAARGRRPRGI